MSAPQVQEFPQLPILPSSQVEVREMRSGEEKEWDDFVHAGADGTFFHLSGWKRTIEDFLGHEAHYLVARRNGAVTGIFPLVRVRSRVFGDSLVSLPLTVYGGICAQDRESHDALLGAASRMGDDFNVKYIEMRNRWERFPLELPGRDLYFTFSQDLSPGPDHLLKRLPKKTRYEIRVGIKSGLEWTEVEELDEFYEIYARNVHRLGTPVFPKQLFVKLRQNLPDAWRVFLVRKDKQAIAGAFCWYYKGSVMPYYVGSLRDAYRYSPNNFMYWKLMEQSCHEGYRCFDFGRSKRGTGSFDFKVSWAMEMEALPYRYKLVRAADIPHLSPVDAKFQAPVAVWKRIPFPLTKIIGPHVIRHIPSV